MHSIGRNRESTAGNTQRRILGVVYTKDGTQWGEYDGRHTTEIPYIAGN